MIFVLAFFLAFALSLILVPLTIFIAPKLGLVDDPKKRSHPALLHKKTVARAGGLPIYLSVVFVSLIFVTLSKQVFGIFLGGLILVVVGLADDKLDLPTPVKFLGQFLAALAVVFSGVGISFITNPLLVLDPSGFGIGNVIHLDTLRFSFNLLGTHSIIILADLFALFWIVWVINMVNFSTGVDGQMPGIVLVTLFVIFAASLRFYPADPHQLLVSQLSLIGAGATFGFLVFNFYPAKIFPGDSGSYFLGFLVAVFAILAGARVGTAILVMAIPLLDGVFTVIRRIAAGSSPFSGDRKHLHHRLLELGWGQRRIALFYTLVCAILGAIALTLPAFGKLFAGVVIATIILGGLLWLNSNLPQKAQK
ncbi:hypothetical protein A2870_04545 [Candidatus Curtissbacteria bacterium RIFCSPHIGHO2_01_FULL_41_11]|uniref:Undecaprenyl-phosphate alpha-N-acetylglucosaminyl 1-phosphate transferase n=1 Tax=Candidatus Curtissbacteria bacterium RIFCSPHIGHO2_01_FULL_41_11 TaxID=1797711 RepID=A0A1F5G8D5_9BACT|nr:MAG: hypothetical protein A2870_04545 [Candidatus Curtissbacteria bacterium RIFCSPHIGHO2_01_FULL_41_11]